MERPALDGLSTETLELIAQELDMASLCALRSTNRQLLAQTLHGLAQRCKKSPGTYTCLDDSSITAMEAVANNSALRNTIGTIVLSDRYSGSRKRSVFLTWPLDASGMIDSSRMTGVARLKAMLKAHEFTRLRWLWVSPWTSRFGFNPQASARLAREVCEAVGCTYYPTAVTSITTRVYMGRDRCPQPTSEQSLSLTYTYQADFEFYWGRKFLYTTDGPLSLEVTSRTLFGPIDRLVAPGDCMVRIKELNLSDVSLSAMTLRSILARSDESLTGLEITSVHLYHSAWKDVLTELADRHPALTRFLLRGLCERPEPKGYWDDHHEMVYHPKYQSDYDFPVLGHVEFRGITVEDVETIMGGSVDFAMPDGNTGRPYVSCRGGGTPEVLRMVIRSISLWYDRNRD